MKIEFRWVCKNDDFIRISANKQLIFHENKAVRRKDLIFHFASGYFAQVNWSEEFWWRMHSKTPPMCINAHTQCFDVIRHLYNHRTSYLNFYGLNIKWEHYSIISWFLLFKIEMKQKKTQKEAIGYSSEQTHSSVRAQIVLMLAIISVCLFLCLLIECICYCELLVNMFGGVINLSFELSHSIHVQNVPLYTCIFFSSKRSHMFGIMIK